jgi:hypothetical protein
MNTNSRKDDLIAVIVVVILLIGAALGNAYAMLGMSVATLIALAVFYQRQIGRGAILVSFAAAVTAAVLGFVVAANG